ncbi:MAG TPA: thiolase domain-containing protein, partial [Thermoplasmata archaeon]|nr:thiolase domain-containing protein [Thermoplasmata archaeon]
AVHDRESMTRLDATIAAARAAYEQAGIVANEVDVAEVHDCFTIAEILAVEDVGFATKGEGGRLAAEGITAKDGKLPVNPSGGLKAKGHPLGATGTAQVHEIFLQLRREAGNRQVPDPEIGLAHNVGGSGATCAVHLFGI